MNRLASATSPYLLQHADNPVDWYPWGAEALARARSEDRPIFLSIGYSACHWCHVMAHESFEDPGTAERLNRDFVAIKVDREERPDLDDVYMGAVQAMTGSGGWRRQAVAEAEAVLDFCGLPGMLHGRAGDLPFVMQKRLELARVLMGKPRVVLLDEPAAGLTSTEVRALDDLIRAVRDRQITVVLIEHNMRLVMGLCDRVTVLDFGRRIADGTPDQVRADARVIEAYLGTSRAGL